LQEVCKVEQHPQIHQLRVKDTRKFHQEPTQRAQKIESLLIKEESLKEEDQEVAVLEVRLLEDLVHPIKEEKVGGENKTVTLKPPF